jgi:hypothetical protein
MGYGVNRIGDREIMAEGPLPPRRRGTKLRLKTMGVRLTTPLIEKIIAAGQDLYPLADHSAKATAACAVAGVTDLLLSKNNQKIYVEPQKRVTRVDQRAVARRETFATRFRIDRAGTLKFQRSKDLASGSLLF